MWPDNESDVDLLGFSVHTQLLVRLVTDVRMLPVAVGVFGDWGGGKSSILRQLQRDLNEQDDVACLTFNGWVFEGYDDAKAALISAILVQLGEHQRIGPKIRGKVASLLKRVDYLRFARVLGRLTGPALAGAATGMAASFDVQHGTSIAPTVASVAAGIAGAAGSDVPLAAGDERAGAIDWQGLIAKAPGPAGPLDIRTFRDEFAHLIVETDLRALVVVVDDLDRCSPERLIENLEAIKLFLAVPRTAFVIAADERIVRHAIRERYAVRHLPNDGAAADEPYDLVTDYLEKLIQVPYHLPRLSPSEVETYMTLLFCQLYLADDGRFAGVLNACDQGRRTNVYRTFGLADVRATLALAGDDIPPELERALQWTSGIAPQLTAGLKGNPRQVKRLLNALLLRRQLAEVAGLALRDEVLVKLMLLEYLDPRLFDELYGWQAAAEGHPPQLAALEAHARGKAGPAHNGDGKRPRGTGAAARQAEEEGGLPSGASPRWQEPAFRNWLVMDPPLTDVDLRDYFWVARDRLHGTAAQLAMVPPYVRKLFEQLLSDLAPARKGAASDAQKQLAADETAALLSLLEGRVRRHPEEYQAIDGLRALGDAGVAGATRTLLDALRTVATGSLPAAVAYTLGDLKRAHPDEAAAIDDLLRRWAEQYPQTLVGKTAAIVLRGPGEGGTSGGARVGRGR